MTWEFSSPLTLLGQWRDRTDEAELHELLLLGFTVDLPFLEKTAIPTARALGARITVIGDAGQGLYDPVDVRMAGRSYFHGLAACRGSFHPKLALLIGAHEAVAAIGSGNPTMAGWGYNDELWTVLRGHETDAPEPFQELGRWLVALSSQVPVPQYAAELLEETAARLADFQTTAHPARVLHNLETGLLDQLPAGARRRTAPVRAVHRPGRPRPGSDRRAPRPSPGSPRRSGALEQLRRRRGPALARRRGGHRVAAARRAATTPRQAAGMADRRPVDSLDRQRQPHRRRTAGRRRRRWQLRTERPRPGPVTAHAEGHRHGRHTPQRATHRQTCARTAGTAGHRCPAHRGGAAPGHLGAPL